MSIAHLRQHVVHEQRRALGHSPAHAGGAKPAALARKRHTKLVATLAACRAQEALLEITTPGEALQLRLHELGQRTLSALLEAREEARQCRRTSSAASQSWV